MSRKTNGSVTRNGTILFSGKKLSAAKNLKISTMTSKMILMMMMIGFRF